MNNKPVITLLPIEQLKRGRFQPRNHFEPQALQELADSLRLNGLIQPIVVRPLNQTCYEIVAGERRWRAAQLAGFNEISCLINHYTDEQAAAVTTIENLQREDLNPIEEAQALQRLIDEFGYLHEEVAAVISSSRTKVTNLLRLLNLDELVKQFLIHGKLSEGHGKMLAGLPKTHQISLAQQAVAEGWSVRKLEKMVKINPSQAVPQFSKNANISRLERLISDQISAKVELESDSKAEGGWLKIKFYDHQTLSGLLERLGINQDEA